MSEINNTHVSKLPLILLAIAAALVLLGIGVYWGGILNLVDRWQQQPEYSHGFLIPMISLYLLWERRGSIDLGLTRRSLWALLPLCFAMVGLIIGELSALFLVIHYSFLLYIFAIATLLVRRGLHYTLVPIGLLAFAIPIPYFLEVILTAKMQLMSSSLGVAFIKLLGIPVLLNGNIIDFGEFQLHVVEACSGMRYLFPLTCIGFVTAFFYRARWWQKTLIFLSTFPITLFMNSFRIAVTGILVENYGSEVADGFIHDFEGWAVFMLCLAILVLEILILERFTSRQSLASAFRPLQYPEQPATHRIEKAGLAGLVASIAIVVLSQVFILKQHSDEEIIYTTSLAAFPARIDAWHGSRVALPHDVIDALGFDDYVNVDYFETGKPSEKINFYVAYYANQRKGDSPHSPRVCIPGGGWEISSFKRTRLSLTSGQDMPVNRVEISKGSNRQLVYYWFIERGDVVANEYRKKWLLFKDALFSQRSDGALVRVVMSVAAGESTSETDKKMAEFIEAAQPQLQRYLP